MRGPSPADRRRPLVIAIGNRFRTDDGVGGAVLDALGDDPRVTGAVELLELDGEPARLVDAWAGRDRVAVIDALRVAGRAPGEVVVLGGADATDPTTVAGWHAGVSGHGAGLAEALRLGSTLDRLPGELSVVGVVASSVAHGTALTPAVADAVVTARDAVIGRLDLSTIAGGGGTGVPR